MFQIGILGTMLHSNEFDGNPVHVPAMTEDSPPPHNPAFRLVNDALNFSFPDKVKQEILFFLPAEGCGNEHEIRRRHVFFPQPVFVSAEERYPVAFTGKHGGQLMGGPFHASLFAQGFIGKIDDDVAHGWSCRHSIHRGMTFSG